MGGCRKAGSQRFEERTEERDSKREEHKGEETEGWRECCGDIC